MNSRITARIAEVRTLAEKATRECDRCRGCGYIGNARCLKCEGHGFVEISRELVPALIEVIQELRFQLHQAMWNQWENAEHKLAAEDQWEEKIAFLLDDKEGK